jgi:hypothetical protein
MRIGIMQPYFFPYIGYFQLIAAVDRFVVYDNIKYTKKGWINRNRILQQGAPHWISLPLKSASDSLDIRGREVAESFDARKLLNQIAGAYRAAPHFKQVMPVIEASIATGERNLFRFLYASITNVCDYLSIRTRLIPSSTIDADHSLRSQQRVIAICRSLGGSAYINPIGGTTLYSRDGFRDAGIELSFLESLPVDYEQFGPAFVPSLSIIDVMMFNSVERVAELISTAFRFIPNGPPKAKTFRERG